MRRIEFVLQDKAIIMENSIFLGTSPEGKQYLDLKWGNRHGLIAGATGTGKTVSLQVLAEGFSKAGVPVFMADVKGDLTGLCERSEMQDFLQSRADKIGLEDYAGEAFPCIMWDLYGEQGHSVRTTVTEIGPVLLARLLELNDTQEGILNITFRVADEQGLLLLDLKDLRAMLQFVYDNRKEISARYGNVAPASISAIQRRLLVLEDQGGDKFLAEPALDIRDLMRTAPDGRGYVNILAADKLIRNPRLYSTFLLWMLSELFEELPEQGDADKPRLVFFFDEAHLLFDTAPKALLQTVEQVVRLIRSKGVGVFFVTQNPADVPDDVLGQLGNKMQHALRAFTPKGKRAVKVAAETFRPNPNLDTEEVITQLGVGEALVSTLESKGVPSVVQQTLIRPPSSRLGPAEPTSVAGVRATSPVRSVYDREVDRESAFELLQARAEKAAEAEKQAEDAARKAPPPPPKAKSSSSRSDSVGTSMMKSMFRTIGTTLGRELVRGVLGSLRR
ncbi:MAG: DUF853 domain-containing protein [Alphaproteobacteria bacterium]